MRGDHLTQEEIAVEANVSITTVCRVLAESALVKADIRQRVLDARERVRHLHTLLSGRRLGLIVPNSRPFFAELAFEFQRECQRLNADLLIANSNGQETTERALCRRFVRGHVQGTLLVSNAAVQPVDISSIASATTATSPVVCVDREVDGFDLVAVDGEAGVLEAVRYLRCYGHRRIGFIRGLRTSSTGQQRHYAFRKAMVAEGLIYEPAWDFWGDYRRSSGERCAQSMNALPVEDRPTALVSSNDEMALSLMYGLKSLGWVLPRDLSIVGFDGVQVTEWTDPALTTIRQPLSRLVRTALQLLAIRMEEAYSHLAPKPRIIQLVRPQLLVRSSVTRAPLPGGDAIDAFGRGRGAHLLDSVRA